MLIAAFDQPGEAPFYDFSVPLHGLGKQANHSRLGKLRWRISAIRKWAKKTRPDVVVAFMHSSYVPACIALKGICPVIASEHTVPDHYRSRPLEGLAATVARALSSETISPTKIPNPVSLPKGVSDPIGHGRKCILSIGRMSAEKNHRLLISAFKEVAHEFPDWYVRIVGDGPLRHDLMWLRADLGLFERVDTIHSHDDVRREYLNAQIFAVPSLYESFGLATAEALSYGLPILGLASCRGTNDLVADGKNGILTTPRKFASSLRKLMADSDLRSRLATGLIDAPRYSISAVTDQWEQTIRSCGLNTRSNGRFAERK